MDAPTGPALAEDVRASQEALLGHPPDLFLRQSSENAEKRLESADI